MTELEIEYKTMLTQEQFNNLKDHFKDAILIKQNNRYFKYSDSNVHIACRIREKGNQATLTFKQDHLEGRLESNFKNIDLESDFFKHEDVLIFLNKNHLDKAFIYIGDLLTYRYQILEEHQEICIDENHYEGVIDYELEVESIDDPQSALNRFYEICDQFKINKESSISKFERYLKQKGL